MTLELRRARHARPQDFDGPCGAAPVTEDGTDAGRSRIAVVRDPDVATNSFFHITGNGTREVLMMQKERVDRARRPTRRPAAARP